MTCGKCGKQIENGATKCRFCGADVQEKEKFVVKIESEEYLSIKDAKEETETQKASETESAKRTANEDIPKVHSGEKYSDAVLRRNHSSASREAQQRAVMVKRAHEKAVERARVQNGTAEKISQKDKPSAGEKKTLVAIKIISVICAVVLVCLSVVSIKTDIFKIETGNKPVALIKLSKEQVQAFEEFAPGFSALFDTGYDSSKRVLDDVISLFEPTNPGGLYCSVNEAATEEADSDPLERYTGCCTVSAESVEAVAKKLGLESYNDIDGESCYFYDGKYYFKKADENTEKKVVAVTDSKKLSDGGYYVTANIYPAGTQTDESGNYSAQKEKTLYFEIIPEGLTQTGALAESTQEQTDGTSENAAESTTTEETAQTDAETNSTDFIIKKISSTELYGSNTQTEGSLEYTIDRKIIQAKCSDGKLFAQYVIEYPHFSDETNETASIINSIYTAVSADFGSNTDSSAADKKYKDFIKQGGTDESLPIYTNVSVSVKYNEGDFISFLERRTVYTGLEKVTAVNEAKEAFESRYGYTPETVEEQDKIYMPETTYEGYTYRISDGGFIKKDEFLGKDYLKVQTDLYNAYISQYGTGEEESTDYTSSDDSGEIGKAIYESAWTIGENDVTFYYKNSNGSVLPVTIARGEIISSEELTAESTEPTADSESGESESETEDSSWD